MAASAGSLNRREREALLDLRQGRAVPLPPPQQRRAIRKAAGVSAEELGALLGVTEDAVFTWEIGSRNPGRKVRDRYAEVLALLASGGEGG